MQSSDLPISELPIIDPDLYRDEGYPHAHFARLRREAPVARIESWEMPYWAVTRHADITSISKQPDLFLSGPRLIVRKDWGDDDFERPPTLIEQDNPKHRKTRKIISGRFTPRALKKIHGEVDRIAKKIVDDVLEREGETVDFVDAVSAPLPIAVIAWLLGVPEEDWPLLFDWTNRSIGFEDPDMHPEGSELQNDARDAIIELFTYFAKLVEDRKKNPKDDLITVFATAEIDGKPLEPLEVLSYCQIIVTAGNETTRNATSGGMLALIEHPDQLRKIQQDPGLLKSGIEEILRWSSPVIHFARTAARDTEVAGVPIREGDTLGLFYPSANRDEAVFDAPETFDVTRNPNRHLAFGVGEHFCAGAHVARLEMEMAYKYLLPRLAEVELAGPVDRLRSNLIGGTKKLPIRFKLGPS